MWILLALARLAGRIKESWEWWAIFAGAGIVPGIPVMLGFLEGQPLSMIALYLVVALAFWLVIIIEGKPLIEPVIERWRGPRLNIKSGTNHPYVQKWSEHNVDVHHTLFRIGVQNTSRREKAHGIAVKLIAIDPHPPEANYIPALLQVMNMASSVKEFTLNPLATELIDVIQHIHNAGLGPMDYFAIHHTVDDAYPFLPFRDYVLALEIYRGYGSPYRRAISIKTKPGVVEFTLEPTE